jgi:hypothetical protein
MKFATVGVGEGVGVGIEPPEKAVQLKTDSTGSVVQTELSTPQLLLMEFKSVAAVTYERDPEDDAMRVLHPNDNVAVP